MFGERVSESAEKSRRQAFCFQNKSGNDLLTAMLADGYEITDKQAIDNAVLNVLAGYQHFLPSVDPFELVPELRCPRKKRIGT